MKRACLFAAACAVGAWAFAPRQPALDDLARRALARLDGEIQMPRASGLGNDVRIARDEWGIPHITAAAPDDLFFAQGYVAAQDRLWQMELWRRIGEGRLAEISGPQAVASDRLARLLKFRGPTDDRELVPYHPEARRLMTAFVNGVNTFIEQHRDRLPIEFVLTGITPEPWTIETLTLRQITFGDAATELQLARSAALLGVAEANRRRNPDPWDDLTTPAGLDLSAITNDVVAATRGGGRVPPPELLPTYRSRADNLLDAPSGDVADPGSNNWVVSGALSTTGKPVVANDPHREVTLPSLRYITHLTAPGWNVIGAAEPPFFGVALGHNDFIAWGLTIVGVDQHDVYVEELNPANRNEVRFGARWEPLKIVREEIRVKGAPSVPVELKFSRHGPIFHEDSGRLRAYALRSALAEPGTAPYLAGLRLSQAKNCREFLAAAAFWNHPSENLICGDVEGNIAWRASALAPIRKAWTGRLPVPGHGGFEWGGFRTDMPSALNPESGIIVTANHNIHPKNYAPPLMFKNADTRFDRITRLRQLLTPGRKYSLEDHQRMQQDAYSLRAAADIPRFRGWTSADPAIERARAQLANWDGVYRRDSAEAAIYETWRATPADLDAAAALRASIRTLESTQGRDWSTWRWGRMHARAFPHVLVRSFDLPDVERPGGAGTVAADGASYREILDVANWDRWLATNTPGQSGQPGSPYYGNLLPLWAENRYFPLAFSRQAVDKSTRHRLTLRAATPR